VYNFVSLCIVLIIILEFFLDFLVNILNRIEYISNFTGPFVVTGFLITAIYWSGVCYGAITMTQVYYCNK